MSTNHVVIIGGGISGLTAAFWLKQNGVPVTVLERDAVPGGTMRTMQDGGWMIETGPNSALETTPVFGQMFDLLGLTRDRLYADAASNNRYILRNGRLHALPMSPPAFLRSRLWTVPGKLRLLKEPFVGRAEREETIAEFVERRLGREFLDYAINPLVAGVYAGDPARLSVTHSFPKLREVAATDLAKMDPERLEAAVEATRAELYEKARAAGVEGRSTMTKDELASAVAGVDLS